MSENKKHHYVPQFYLRQFRIGNRDSIGVATLDPFRFIASPASIKGQCQSDHFYGKDGKLDGLLQQAESVIAPMLRRVNASAAMDENTLGGMMLLAVGLHLRTRKASEIAKLPQRNLVTEVIQAAIARGELPAPDDPEDVNRFDFPTMPQFLAQFTAPLAFEMLNLDCKLLRPATGHFFITSDNPVILLNQFGWNEDPHRQGVGFGQCGFQLMLPIGPELCVCFFDPGVYKVGARNERVVALTATDTAAVNCLQVQSAENCLYFHTFEMRETIHRLVNHYGRLRRPISATCREIPGPNPGETIVWMRTLNPQVPDGWSFMRLLRHPRGRPGKLRNAVWSSAAQRAVEQCRADPRGPNVWERLDQILLGPGESSVAARPSSGPLSRWF